MSKYAEFFRIEFANAWRGRAALAARVGFYGVILFVFASLWRATGKSAALGDRPAMLVWYLALTEILVLSYPMVHWEIEEDVRTGALAYAMLRPASYFWSRYCRAFGALVARALVLSLGGVVFLSVFGGVPDRPEGLWLFPPLALASVAVGLVFQVAIGICAFWLQEASPLYWIWQKCLFILGGLILPFEIYPAWLREAAMWTPFPYLLYLPVRACLSADVTLAGRCLLASVGWLGLALAIAGALFHRARKGLVLNGG